MIGNSIQELDSLIGLENVKQQVHSLIKFIQVQQQREKHNLKTTPISYHCVFSGSPGTGKTTVARILAQIYKDLGVLKKGHLIETDRAGLVGEYVGQTAVKTNKVINSAVGGVLFIDEAYSLYSESAEDYGREAIATLLKRMEDERNNLVVVMAGYTEEMKQFIDINPGLRSRFNRYIDFTDYSPDELYQIFKRYIDKEDFKLTPESELAFQKLFAEAYEKRDRTFGNARFVRNIFEKTIERQSLRVADITEPTVEQLTEIMENDVPKL
ncbi:MAG: AAA family ATPase [Bacteroidales bacterium]|nr:AAA family ATPase [Bacteroidales bacterium]